MLKISEVVRRLLEREHSPFADRFHGGLEIQLEPFDEEVLYEAGWYQGAWPIRIPKNAKSEPIDNDTYFRYPPNAIHRIGWSGWHWRDRASEFVVYDLDSIANHEAGLNDAQLEAAKNAVLKLPYATLRRSKSGLGFHVYVDLPTRPATAN